MSLTLSAADCHATFKAAAELYGCGELDHADFMRLAFDGMPPFKWWQKNRRNYELSLDELRQRIKPIEEAPDVCGVYMLFDLNEIVYVGQSKSIYRRLHQHHDQMLFLPNSPPRVAAWVECPGHFMMTDLELFYWKRFKPKGNIRRPQCSGRSGWY